MTQLPLFTQTQKAKIGGLRFPQHVRDKDAKAFSGAKRQIWAMLLAGDWISTPELIAATGSTRAPGRVWEIKKTLEALDQGTIECRRRGDGRTFEYRFITKE